MLSQKSNINNNLRKVQLGNTGGVNTHLEHYYVLCSRLFDNIVSDPNHKLKALLPPDYDNSRYNLRRQRHFNMPKLCTNRTSNTFIYAMSKQSGL